MNIRREIAALVCDSIKESSGMPANAAEVESSFQTPKEGQFGDLTTHIALRLARERQAPSRPLAEELRKLVEARLKSSALKDRLSRVTVEGPGFINFYYSNVQIAEVLFKIRDEGNNFGKPRLPGKKNILLEFVSANPTGPLTVAHGRQAALGDSLARILKFAGHRVTTEYYNNDEGVQIDILGESTSMRLRQLLNDEAAGDLPENYYQGGYLIDIAGRLRERKPEIAKLSEKERLKICSAFARDEILEGIKKDLSDFGVHFDNYYSQEKLGRSGKVEKALEILKKKGVIYENEGACWFRSTDFSDDKDRVLVKSDKSYTYLTPDIAYHHEKFERGFDELINIWGPDHHGYIPRLKASQAALGHDIERVRILIAQLVTLYEGGKQVRMSTRAGEFVTLREIIDEVGKDAGRFFFLMRKFDQHLDFDLALAKSQTMDNPVFYIQYAHARIESIKKTLEEKGGAVRWNDRSCVGRLSNPMEIELLRTLSQYEETIAAAERTLEPYRLVSYLRDLAGAFHRFYADNRVVTEDAALTNARMMLVCAAQAVLRSGLDLLGVSAPLKM